MLYDGKTIVRCRFDRQICDPTAWTPILLAPTVIK
jgi:hypothetical protein